MCFCDGELTIPCGSREADSQVVEGHLGSEKQGTGSFKTFQEIKSNEKKKKSRMWKWSREGPMNPLLPSGDIRGGFVFTEEMLEPAFFVKVFARGPNDPLENKNGF